MIPFASHPVCRFDWFTYFKDQLSLIGAFIRSNNVRISMHPGQYTLINSPDDGILTRSIRELRYHTDLLDALELNASAKIQVHIGGVYGDKDKSIRRFIERYSNLDKGIKRRLVIENDDRSYTIDDCVRIYGETGVPLLFDTFHHELNHSGSSSAGGLADITRTWQVSDGIPMVDYSHCQVGGANVNHTESIDISLFERFLTATQPYDFDIMLEIKDKETSALKAIQVARKDKRFFHGYFVGRQMAKRQ